MLKVIETVINNNDEPFAVKKIINFEDANVNLKQFEFIKDHLIDYILFKQSEYLVEFKKPVYNKSIDTIFIDFIITIPDKIFRKENTTWNQLFKEQEIKFKQFYEILKQEAN